MKRHFSSLSIRGVVISMAVLIILPLFAMILYFQFIMARDIRNDAFANTKIFSNQLTNEMYRQFSFLNSMVTFMLTDSTLQSAVMNDVPLSHVHMMKTESFLQNNSYGGYGTQSNLIHNIYLFRSETNFAGIGPDYYRTGSLQRSLSIYNTYKNNLSSVQLIPQQEDGQYLYYILNYIDLNTQKPCGMVVMELNIFPLLQNEYLDAYPDSYVYLYDRDGTIYLSNNPTDKTTVSTYIQNGYQSTEFPLLSVAGENYYAFSAKVRNHSYQVLILTPQADVLSTLYRMMRVFYPLAILYAIVSLGVALLLSQRLNRSLRDMMHKLDAFVGSGFKTRMPAYGYAEINHVSNSFNSMAQELEHVVNEVYETRLLGQEMELELLYSQINPHFLYNVLDVIRWSCIKDGANDAAEHILNLSGMLRELVQLRGRDKARLAEELDYVEFYLRLQKARFHQKLSYSIKVESPALYNFVLPSMTIQPLVENSCVHGIEKKRGEGHIDISVWEEDRELYIRVEDDGIGFDASAEKGDSGGSGVALQNIQKRLVLLHGSKCRLKISSTPGKGTCVLLIIPEQPQNK